MVAQVSLKMMDQLYHQEVEVAVEMLKLETMDQEEEVVEVVAVVVKPHRQK